MPQSYKISKQAEEDWRNIVRYTLDKYGKGQVQKYTAALINCLDDLVDHKGLFREIKISDKKVIIKHCHKHYIFAYERSGQSLLIIAILHERMDLMQRVKNRLK